jgi:F-type H+-transporting ATPase subunit O
VSLAALPPGQMAFRNLALRLSSAAAPRSFATAAAATEAALPLKLFGLPARYASALYLAAAKAKALPEVEKDLKTVVELAAANATFAEFLLDPSQTKTAKLKGIGSILEAGKFSATTKQFFGARGAAACAQHALGSARHGDGRLPVARPALHSPPCASAVLAENGRLQETHQVVDKFEQLMMASRGEVQAVVTSAEVRPARSLARSSTLLAAAWSAGSRVRSLRACAALRSAVQPCARSQPSRACVRGEPPLLRFSRSVPVQALSPAELAAAKAALEKLLTKGQSLNMKTAVKPDIIGGLVIDIGDKHLDLSLNSRIRKVEQLIAQTI